MSLAQLAIFLVVAVVVWFAWQVASTEVPLSASMARLGRIVIVAVVVLVLLLKFLLPYLGTL